MWQRDGERAERNPERVTVRGIGLSQRLLARDLHLTNDEIGVKAVLRLRLNHPHDHEPIIRIAPDRLAHLKRETRRHERAEVGPALFIDHTEPVHATNNETGSDPDSPCRRHG